MALLLAFLWGVVARLRNYRSFPAALMIAWADIRFITDRVLLSTQFALGVWLAMPLTTFASSAGYRKMSELLPEFWWGILLIAVTVIHIDSMIHSNMNVRRNVALLEMGLWIFIAWASVVSNPVGLGVPIFALLGYHFYRIYKKSRG
jgi:hypothetical protein